MKAERKRMFRVILGGFMLFLLIFWFIYTGQKLLHSATPILIGLIIAYTMNIGVQFIRKHDFLYHRKMIRSERVHNILSTVLAVIVLLGCIAMIAFYLAPQLTACVITLLDKVPSGIRYLLAHPMASQLIPEETMETLRKIDWTNWINHLINMVSSDDLFRSMTVTATSALSAFSNILFGILFACYFLSGRNTVLKTAVRMVRVYVPENRQEQVLHDGKVLNSCFHNFLVCQALQALIIGISASVLMNLFGFPYASMIGTLNGVCALIPVIGGYIGAVLGTLMILTDAPGMALFFLIFIVVLQNVIGMLVFPRLIGQSLGIPSGWTLAAVLVGSGLGGIMGILLAVPLTAFVYRMLKDHLEAKEREKQAEAEKAPEEEEPKPEPEKTEPAEVEEPGEIPESGET